MVSNITINLVKELFEHFESRILADIDLRIRRQEELIVTLGERQSQERFDMEREFTLKLEHLEGRIKDSLDSNLVNINKPQTTHSFEFNSLHTFSNNKTNQKNYIDNFNSEK